MFSKLFSCSIDTTSTSSSSVMIVVGEKETAIPCPFSFRKHYIPDIEIGLQMKQLSPKLQAKLYMRIANVMFMYKRYPTKDEYQSVARQVIEKYPFLLHWTLMELQDDAGVY